MQLPSCFPQAKHFQCDAHPFRHIVVGFDPLGLNAATTERLRWKQGEHQGATGNWTRKLSPQVEAHQRQCPYGNTSTDCDGWRAPVSGRQKCRTINRPMQEVYRWTWRQPRAECFEGGAENLSTLLRELAGRSDSLSAAIVDSRTAQSRLKAADVATPGGG